MDVFMWSYNTQNTYQNYIDPLYKIFSKKAFLKFGGKNLPLFLYKPMLKKLKN